MLGTLTRNWWFVTIRGVAAILFGTPPAPAPAPSCHRCGCM